MDQQFSFEFEAPTNTIYLNASYPGGHEHRTSITLDELDDLLQSGKQALAESFRHGITHRAE